MGDDTLDGALAELAADNRRLRRGEAPEGIRSGRGRTVDLQFIRELMYSLEAVSIGTHQLLYFAAMTYAKHYLEPAGADLGDAVAALDDMFDSMDVGTLELAGQDGDEARIALHDSAIAADGPTSDDAICYFVAGYIAGYLEHCLDADYVVNETHCSAETGEDVCRFTARER